ncbi:hypothetical protein C0Q70_05045 [Pomacea canaliculata]|uniref:Uncharacterized protein n=1 Tax=Pomacea canaliculata TaxID=400727 RepID=A0A2T7PK65_POMCA|nr:hypothetical protein C0Q70_05045 [Pomacea canaliculata]
MIDTVSSSLKEAAEKDGKVKPINAINSTLQENEVNQCKKEKQATYGVAKNLLTGLTSPCERSIEIYRLRPAPCYRSVREIGFEYAPNQRLSVFAAVGGAAQVGSGSRPFSWRDSSLQTAHLPETNQGVPRDRQKDGEE